MKVFPLPLRFFCDATHPSDLLDLNTSASPVFYRGCFSQIDIGLGNNGALLTHLANSGPGGIASVTLQIFKNTKALVITATIPAAVMNLTLSKAQWINNKYTRAEIADPVLPTTFQHASFNILTGLTSIRYWLRITVLTTDTPANIITFLNGPIVVKDRPPGCQTYKLSRSQQIKL